MACAEPNHRDYDLIYHELGHIYNFLFYGNQPYLFRDTANPAFHEAVGDALSLSAMSATHLKKIDLLKTGAVSKGRPYHYHADGSTYDRTMN